MRRSDYWICCWPGLSAVWREGQPQSLLLAVAFAALLNLAMISTLVWPHWLNPQISAALWPAVALLWFGSAWLQIHRHRGQAIESIPGLNTQDTLFIQAQAEYLKGNWEEAEWLLRQRLATCHRDIESRLLLLTLYRRRGRIALASDQLQILKRFDGSTVWADEIQRESRFLETGQAASRQPPEQSDSEVEQLDSTAESELRTINTNGAHRAA